jgi:hypothetical protein
MAVGMRSVCNTEQLAALLAEEVYSGRIQESAGLFEQMGELQTLTNSELREVLVVNPKNATAPDL